MRNLTKKIMIYSMVGLMQVGLGATVVAASPLYNDGPQRIVQLDDGYYHDGYRHHDREERRRHENERHEREMQRRHYESRRDWNDRQWRENQRHDNTMNEIAAGVVGFILGSATN
jgi:hypothetical protein